MKILGFRENGSTGNIERVFLFKNSGATAGTEGDPITGLTHDSTGLSISTIADGEATPVTETVAGTDDIEPISTIGTYAAPSSGKVRFAEVNAAGMPGLYEIQLSDSRYSVGGAKYLDICISGATDLAAAHYRVWLDVQSTQDLGLMYESTISTVSTTKSFDMTEPLATDSQMVGNTVTVVDAGNATNVLTTWVTAIDQANNRITVNDEAAGWTVASGDNLRIKDVPHPGYYMNAVASSLPSTDFVLAMFQLMGRRDDAIRNDRAVELGLLNQDEGSGPGSYDNLTDALQDQQVDVRYINGALVLGSGQTADKWRG